MLRNVLNNVSYPECGDPCCPLCCDALFGFGIGVRIMDCPL